MSHKRGTCWECAKALEGGKRFCDRPCKQAWNNRRAARGAQVYDLLMGLRFEREAASRDGVWSVICRLASDWHEADQRAARRGYDMQSGLERLPHATGVMAVRQAL